METGLLTISSPAFTAGGFIPDKYTCAGAALSPPLKVDGIPDNALSLALIAADPDAPDGTFDHWIVWNIDPLTPIEEDSIPGISGRNSAGRTGYHAPCPPHGRHRYFFYVFALDTTLDLPVAADRAALEAAMSGHILARGYVLGLYGGERS